MDRETGEYRLSQVEQGWVAIINDLHKGRDTGPVWSWVIDISAVVLTLISITGLALIFWLRLKRRSGIIIAIIGLLLVIGAYFFV